MIYKVTIKFYDEYEEDSSKSEKFRYLFVNADTFKELVGKMTTHYGEEPILFIAAETFSPDDFLEFKEEDKDIYDMVSNKLEKDITWW